MSTTAQVRRTIRASARKRVEVVSSARPPYAAGVAGEWYVYVARCGDASLYAGITTDVARRIAEHDAGEGARYTRGRGPVELVEAAGPFDKGDALRLEARVKRARGPRKLAVLRAGPPASPTEEVVDA